jgi:o-succinylbenzoate synthase
MRLELARVSYRLREPLDTAHGTLSVRELIEVTLFADDGLSGRGEAAPLESYDGVRLEMAERALRAYAPVLAEPVGPPGTILERCRALADLPQALAAIDMALWDLAGKRAGKPVCALLADEPATRIEVNATIARRSVEDAVAAARRAVADGFRTIKLKVGLGDDIERVRAVREAIGPEVALRLDANGAWSDAEAARVLYAIGGYALELVEEPVRGLEATARLRERVPVRIALDESADLPGALTARVADAISLKISRRAGIGGLLAAASLVRASGAEAYLSSTFDGPLGIAAALHAAAALAPLPPCGLATLELFEASPQFPVRAGAITVPQGPGLGVA